MSTLGPIAALFEDERPTASPSLRERAARGRVLLRRAVGQWRTAAGILALGVVTTVLATSAAKRTYRSECVVVFKAAADGQEGAAARGQRIAPRLRELLLTRGRLEAIVREHHLYGAPAGNVGDAVDELRGRIGFRAREGDTFALSFDGEGADLARTITRELADAMLAEFTRAKVGEAGAQAGFLAVEAKSLEKDLENAHGARARFLALHPELGLDATTHPGAIGGPGAAGGGTGLAANPTPGVDPESAALDQRRAQLEEILKRGRTRGARGSSTRGPAPLVAARDEARGALDRAKDALAQQRAQYTEQHPDVVAARREVEAQARALARADEALAAAAPAPSAPAVTRTVASSAPIARAAVRRELAEVRTAIAARKARIAAALAAPHDEAWVSLQTEWQRLVRRATELGSALADLNGRAERARLSASAARGAGGDALEILDPPSLPGAPIRDGKARTALACAFAALLTAGLAAVLKARWSDLVLDDGDVAALGVGPVLAVVPWVGPRGPAPLPTPFPMPVPMRSFPDGA